MQTTQIIQLQRNIEDEIFSQMVALKAWQIWREEGCPEGRSDYHWKLAEEALVEVRDIELKGTERPANFML